MNCGFAVVKRSNFFSAQDDFTDPNKVRRVRRKVVTNLERAEEVRLRYLRVCLDFFLFP